MHFRSLLWYDIKVLFRKIKKTNSCENVILEVENPMTKKDILELKKRLSKTDCTITRMCGCYVDANRNKVVKLSETFLNLEDDEFYKYLDIARKCLSGNVGNNLLQLEYSLQ